MTFRAVPGHECSPFAVFHAHDVSNPTQAATVTLLVVVAWISIAAGLACALGIAADIGRGRRQHMGIMNLVWPLTALYAGPLALFAYKRVGLGMTREAMRASVQAAREPASKHRSLAAAAALGATHCGSGCTLGDVVAEGLVVLFPVTLFGTRLFAAWTIDFVLAFLFGIAFQYFTIKPMRHLSPAAGLAAAVKADAASLTAWQVGMYGWMAIATFGIFERELDKASPVFWFMMQIGMLAGFLTSWPINAWLIAKGLKERM